MISVIIPTLNAQTGLGQTFAALVPAAVEGLVTEVIVTDGGSTDDTAAIADATGAKFIEGPGGGRGPQLIAGAAAARGRWLLFLHADTVLETGWEREVEAHINSIESGGVPQTAAAFRFALNDTGFAPRWLEWVVAMRCAVFRLPYGDQGLLISRALYDKVGGFAAIPLMEDVDFVLRLGRNRLVILRSRAVTSAEKYKRDGYLKRMARNSFCMTLYLTGVSPQKIVNTYLDGKARKPESDLPQSSTNAV
ncbi:MAG: TIGR04283 family arsenosugar biosynthesis glycosyltransferase [Hyphomicrobiales bacterium]|nr:TIGR04283 family arsenosugar biosynthesis glycosyltransferase [Hyphomicrobiales bacterium]